MPIPVACIIPLLGAFLMTWNEDLDHESPAYQIAASESRYVRVVAGPGTGKSFAMKRRVARLLEADVEPRKILPVTFTRVAAEDLHRELVGMDVPGCEDLQGTTLHSLAVGRKNPIGVVKLPIGTHDAARRGPVLM